MSTKVYHATLYEQSGYLTRVRGALTFLDAETGAVTELDETMLNFIGTGAEVPALFATAILARLLRGYHTRLTCRLGS